MWTLAAIGLMHRHQDQDAVRLQSCRCGAVEQGAFIVCVFQGRSGPCAIGGSNPAAQGPDRRYSEALIFLAIALAEMP